MKPLSDMEYELLTFGTIPDEDADAVETTQEDNDNTDDLVRRGLMTVVYSEEFGDTVAVTTSNGRVAIRAHEAYLTSKEWV